MAERTCATCGAVLEPGYVTSSNGSGLFWAHDHPASRPRPTGLEVLAPTGFGGTYSASLPALRCPQCKTILIELTSRP
ncbi:MAG TPA: PF20097 family protein [Thermoplasmata archaeon]|nr:PF20097 family protein [Thermoplasmata archaeon]